MKKVLFASTALVAAGLLASGSAAASEKISLKLGGYSKWWVVGAWQDSNYERAVDDNTTAGVLATGGGNGNGSPNSVDVKGDNEIWFGGSTTLDNGLKVGIDVQLEAGGQTDNGRNGQTDPIDESYVWIEGGFGKFIIGSENNGAYLLHVMAPDAAGNWAEGSVVLGNQAIIKPANVATLGGGNTTAINTDGDAEKITYVSPSFYGLTVGGSYVPNAREDDAVATATADEIYGVGALYANTFGGVGVKVSAGYVTYDISRVSDRSQEWSAGAQLSYAGFTLGGSYRDVKQNFGKGPTSGGLTPTVSSDGYGYDVGLQYASGPYAVSLGYFKSEVEGSVSIANSASKDVIEVWQASAKYNLGAGVDVLASIAHAEYDDETASAANGDANHNEGWTVMTGLSLAF